MDMSFFIALSAVFLIGLLVVLISRSGMIVLMLLPASQIFGIIDPMTLAVRGVFDIHALLAALIAISIIASLKYLPDLRRGILFGPMLVLVGLWLYGIFYPVYEEYSTLFYSLKASKEFLTVFAYYAVFLFLRTERDVVWGWRIVIALGIYYSILELLAQIFGFSLMRHTTYLFRPEGGMFWKIYPPFWTVILIALLEGFYAISIVNARAYLRTAVASVGLLLTFFRSYLLGTVFAVPLILVLSRQGIAKTARKSLGLVSVVFGTLIVIGVLVGGGFKAVVSLSDDFFLSGVTEFSTQSGGALMGREAVSAGRKTILEQSPYIGFGFIEKESSFGQQLRRHLRGDTLGFVDKGNLDVALKFGYVGSVLLYGTIAYMILVLIRAVRRSDNRQFIAHAMTGATVMVIYLVVQPVHASLTYSFSLLPLGIILGLLERERLLLIRKAQPK